MPEVKENWIDHVLRYVAPVKAMERLKARLAMSSYTGASRSLRSLSSWQTSLRDSDGDVLLDLPTLRQRSRDLIRNQPLAAGVLHTVCTHVVGTGLRLQVRLDRDVLKFSDQQADAWAAQVEREFALWAESPDCGVSGNLSFFDAQKLGFRSSLESGDCFILLPGVQRFREPYSLRLQLIEADRVCNRDHLPDSDTLAGGVEKDNQGYPIAYHILQGHPGSLTTAKKGSWQVIPAWGNQTGRRNVIHLMRPLRPGQTRGVPYLAPVIEAFKQLGAYTQAEVSAAVVSAMLTVFVKTPEGQSGLGRDVRQEREGYRLGNGSVIDLAQGEDITTVAPGRPNVAFDPFVQSILRQIGVALELPFEVLVKHFTASYSAARAALLEAWQFFNAERMWLATHFCQAVYAEWFTQAVALGRVQAPGFLSGDPMMRAAYLGAVWIGPAPGQIDPLKEIVAAAKRIELGISSLAREAAALSGIDWETELHQQCKEKRLREAAGFLSPERQHESR